MIYAVLLCNKEWNIVKIKQNVSGLSLKPGDCLADVGRILRTFKIKKNVEVTDNGKIII